MKFEIIKIINSIFLRAVPYVFSITAWWRHTSANFERDHQNVFVIYGEPLLINFFQLFVLFCHIFFLFFHVHVFWSGSQLFFLFCFQISWHFFHVAVIFDNKEKKYLKWKYLILFVIVTRNLVFLFFC